MSLTILQLPPVVALAGNDIRFKVTTNNHRYTDFDGGAFLEINFIIGEPLTVDENFTLSWNGESLHYNIDQYENTNNSQSLPGGNMSEDDARYIHQKLLSNYALNRDFIIEWMEYGILAYKTVRLTPKINSSAYVITVVNAIDTAIVFENNQGPIYIEQTNFRINSVIEIDSEIVGEDSLQAFPMETENTEWLSKSVFTIQEYLKAKLSTEFLFPEVPIYPEPYTALIIARPNICKKYIAKFYEIYGTVPFPYALNAAPDSYILSGGISKELESKLNSEQTNIWEKIKTEKMFLTWAENYKLTRYNNTEKLFYLNIFKTGVIRLYAFIKYTDGTTLNAFLYELQGCEQYCVYEICCSAKTLNLNYPNPTKTIQYYRISLQNLSGDEISAGRFYYLDNTYYEKIRQFIFYNSFNVPDTFWSFGEVQKEVGVTATELAKKLPELFIDKDAQFTQERGTEIQTFKASFRCKNIDEVEYMREFFVSDYRVEIIADKLFPINLISSKVSLHKDNEYLYSVDIEYRRAYEDNYYSKVPGQTGMPQIDYYLPDFNEPDFFTSN